MSQRLPVVLMWHMHQPQYRDALTGEYVLPWTYLHALKDYADMAAHLEENPQARAVVNFTPVLIEQLQEYAQRVASHLRTGAPVRDPVLATLTVPVSRYAVWNATASVPTGLYLIRGKASLHVGERVAVEPPPAMRNLLAERNYLPRGVPLLKRVAALRQTLAGPANERANAVKRRDALTAQTITLKQKAEAASAASARPTPKSEAALDLDSTVRDLAALRDQLRMDPRWRTVREAKPLCEPIFAAVRQSNALPTSVPHDFACEPQGEARDLLSARDETIAARAAFDQKCGLEGGLRDELSVIVAKIRAAPASDRAAAANGFNDAKTLIDACVVSGKAAGLSEDEVRELLKKSDAYLRTHSSERNKFELAREAFWSFTPDSTMAICVAMAQDAFLFIMKFLSEIFKRSYDARERRQFAAPLDLSDDEDQPTDVRAMKAVMRAAHPVHGDMSEIDPKVEAISALPPNVNDNVVAILNRLVRDEIAHVDRKGAYLVDNVTIAQIEARLFSALKPRAARALYHAADGAPQGPRGYYADVGAAHLPRRRCGALERYLIAEAAPMDRRPSA